MALFISPILLADDHPVVRDGIHNRLDREADLFVVGEAATGEETIRQVRRTRPDVGAAGRGHAGTGPGPGDGGAAPEVIMGSRFLQRAP